MRHLHPVVRAAAAGLLLLVGGRVHASSAVEASDGPPRLGVAAGIASAITDGLGGEVGISASASAEIARQALEGGPFDAVVLADPAWMDLLEREGRLEPGTRRLLGTHRLVFAVPSEAGEGAFTLPVGRLAVADPLAAPLGAASRQMIESLGGIDRVADDLVLASDARAVAAMVASRAVAAGVVYASDASTGAGLQVVRRVESTTHDPVVVEVAAVRGSPRGRAAVDLVDSAAVRARLAAAGLEPIAEGAARPAIPSSSKAGGGAGPSWWRPVVISIRVASVAVLAMLAPGVAIAWWLARSRSRWTGVVEAVVDLPLVLPPVVVGYLLLRMLGRGGVVGGVLHEHLGIDLAFTWWAAAIASGVMGFPLLVRSARPAIASVDRDLERAAANAGAGRWRTFRTVTLPLAGPGIVAGGTLAFARSLGEFGATVLVAGNLPGETRTLALAIWSETRVPGREAQVAGLVLVAVGLSIGATMLSRGLIKRLPPAARP